MKGPPRQTRGSALCRPRPASAPAPAIGPASTAPQGLAGRGIWMDTKGAAKTRERDLNSAAAPTVLLGTLFVLPA
ncbi:uncharacterized protein TrAtP1_001871 [Trichoderma atroviride]|uniref:uncharacterized protein n=1 Tax=Hypocrea atroviridis TaxID=63577 RepID=UPI00331C9D6D|nr:hypothetical protein TrAtP1_001871 [Trichoderma atroviride]